MTQLMRDFLSFLIGRVKRDPSYQVDSDLHLKSIFIVLLEKFVMLVRASICFPWLKSCGFPFFLGKSVCLKHRHNLTLGRGCVIGNNVTLDALSRKGIVLGRNVSIPDHTFIRCTGVLGDLGVGLSIGNNSGLGHFNFINAQGGVAIGEDVIVGPHVKFLSENHNFNDPDVLIRKQGVRRQGIIIGNNVWIGAGVCILDGVTIGNGAVVAAGAVVNRDVAENMIVAGCPAKVIKSRCQPQALQS